jgi:hypothetical protein
MTSTANSPSPDALANSGAGDQAVTRYLLAAATDVRATSIEKRFVELMPEVRDTDVTALNNNPGLVGLVRERWPECTIVPAPKGRSETRKLLNQSERLVLYWDGEGLTKLLFEARLAQIPTRLVPVQVTRVVNKKLTSDFDVYIGRGSLWGNPFAISRSEDGPDRADVIERYKEHFFEKIHSDQSFARGVLGLRGLRLACFCKPEACHGDVIAEYLDSLD